MSDRHFLSASAIAPWGSPQPRCRQPKRYHRRRTHPRTEQNSSSSGCTNLACGFLGRRKRRVPEASVFLSIDAKTLLDTGRKSASTRAFPESTPRLGRSARPAPGSAGPTRASAARRARRRVRAPRPVAPARARPAPTRRARPRAPTPSRRPAKRKQYQAPAPARRARDRERAGRALPRRRRSTARSTTRRASTRSAPGVGLRGRSKSAHRSRAGRWSLCIGNSGASYARSSSAASSAGGDAASTRSVQDGYLRPAADAACAGGMRFRRARAKARPSRRLRST